MTRQTVLKDVQNYDAALSLLEWLHDNGLLRLEETGQHPGTQLEELARRYAFVGYDRQRLDNFLTGIKTLWRAKPC